MVAAVDLGSNSFHLIVARIDQGHMHIIDRIKESVRFAEALETAPDADPAVIDRALACLERFGQRLRALPAGSVRAVGTNTLRQLDPATGFIERAEAALGHPIDVIAGREEARLIYLGVAHGLAAGMERRLVVDIGGGSTEAIVGVGFSPRLRESMHMGCVSLTQRYFADGRISERAMRRAELAGALEVRPIREQFRRTGWQRAVGSSGTIKAIGAVIAAEGWCDDGISAAALRQLRDALVAAGKTQSLALKTLSEERKPVFAGGVAVLRAIFETLGIAHMQVSDYALREGLIYEMMGRHQHEDVRERTVAKLIRQFHIDQAHAEQVRASARMLHRQVSAVWHLDHPEQTRLLQWAARLHEIGLMVAHSQYQKHGAYLLRNADLAGFTHHEQAILATLVLGHRRRFPVQECLALPHAWQDATRGLCVILRLAFLLNRGRSASQKPSPTLTVDGVSVALRFPEGWLTEHPLTQMELEQEAERLAASGLNFTFS